MIGPLSDQATTSTTCIVPSSSSDDEENSTLISSFLITTINIAVFVRVICRIFCIWRNERTFAEFHTFERNYVTLYVYQFAVPCY